MGELVPYTGGGAGLGIGALVSMAGGGMGTIYDWMAAGASRLLIEYTKRTTRNLSLKEIADGAREETRLELAEIGLGPSGRPSKRPRVTGRRIRIGRSSSYLGNFSTGEVKYQDDQGSSLVFTVPAAQIVGPINDLAGGTAVNERIGRQVQCIGIDLDMEFFTLNKTKVVDLIITATLGPYMSCRYAVVVDNQANGAPPLYTDIYNESIPATQDVRDKYNVDNAERFIVLCDKQFRIPIQVTNLTGVLSHLGIANWHIRKKIPCNFMTVWDSAGDITTGAVYVIVWEETMLSSLWIQNCIIDPRVWYKN